ncbi:unnamed protein product, partial [Rotaria sp. Silwood1]
MTECRVVSDFVSSVIRLDAKSDDVWIPMKQAAEVLNVPTPANWANFINPTTTNGSIGQAQVGSSNIATIMENWSISQQFRNQAIQNVKLLIAAADEGSYTAQAFIFDIQSSASLTSLIVVKIVN